MDSFEEPDKADPQFSALSMHVVIGQTVSSVFENRTYQLATISCVAEA